MLEATVSSFVVAALASLLLVNSPLSNIIKKNLDMFYTVDASGLGLSLFVIHIYVTKIKSTYQALWGLSVVRSLATYTVISLLATVPLGELFFFYISLI